MTTNGFVQWLVALGHAKLCLSLNRLQTPETLWGKKQFTWRNLGCSRDITPFWVCSSSNVPLQSLNGSKTIHEQCLLCSDGRTWLHSVRSFFYWGSGVVKITLQGRQKIESRGVEWVWTCSQGHYFVIRDGSIIPTEVPSTCLVALRRTGPAVTDPPLCSVLQMGGGAVKTTATGVHGGDHAAGWETIKHIPQAHSCRAIWNLAKGHLPHAHKERKYDWTESMSTNTFSKLLPQHMHLYTVHFLVVCHSVCTQQSCTRSSYRQEDVCQIRKTILQTHQERSLLDIDINIKYHQQFAIMFLFR